MDGAHHQATCEVGFNRTLTIGTMKKLAIAFLVILLSRVAYGADEFVITDIKINGIERLDEGTVFNYLPLKVGDELNDEEAQLSIKKLFATGFFKDVTLAKDGTTLIVNVVERPSIALVTVEGNDELETEAINNGLEQAGLVQGRIFNKSALEQVRQEVKGRRRHVPDRRQSCRNRWSDCR